MHVKKEYQTNSFQSFPAGHKCIIIYFNVIVILRIYQLFDYVSIIWYAVKVKESVFI